MTLNGRNVTVMEKVLLSSPEKMNEENLS